MKLVALLAVAVALAWLAFETLVQPSNQRDWDYGADVLPAITTRGSVVDVHNVRDYHWTADGGVSSAQFIDRSFDLEQIERVWFVEEPFTLPPFYGFEGVAHTYFVFDFKDRPPVAVSVESRRERGETYDPLRGMLKQYELIYIWGTEQDLTGRRGVLEKNELYMYPLNLPVEATRQLFQQLASVTHDLEEHPRFYDTLTSNCTNELAKAANAVKADTIPLNIALVLPGFSDEVLYDLGFLPTDLSLDDLRRQSYVSDLVIAADGDRDFSTALRASMQRRQQVA